jgi:hypothetical protein
MADIAPLFRGTAARSDFGRRHEWWIFAPDCGDSGADCRELKKKQVPHTARKLRERVRDDNFMN